VTGKFRKFERSGKSHRILLEVRENIGHFIAYVKSKVITILLLHVDI